MHGRDVGAFRFILQSPNRQQTILFTKHGSQSTQWQYKELHVPAHTIQQGSRLVFEATVGRQHLSDIAVDDIKVSWCFIGTYIHISKYRYVVITW